MNAYNPLDSMKRLEQAGLTREHAEAIAAEINDSTEELVTKSYFKEQLDATINAALDKQLIKLGGLVAALIILACTVMGVILQIK